jgi:tRNA threonylcarbamoyl adenosine modification protein YjeE
MFSHGLMHEKWRCAGEGGLVEADSFVADVSGRLHGGVWLFLTGDLGAGKTTFVRVLVAGISEIKDVTSPTFSVLNLIDLQGSQVMNVTQLVHLDLYRLKSGRELNFLGIENHVSPASLVVVEWPEVVEEDEWQDFFEITGCMRPQEVVEIEISYIAEEESRRSYQAVCYTRD